MRMKIERQKESENLIALCQINVCIYVGMLWKVKVNQLEV